MRPYMLWLARVYAGMVPSRDREQTRQMQALKDWLNYQHAQRFLVDAWRR